MMKKKLSTLSIQFDPNFEIGFKSLIEAITLSHIGPGFWFLMRLLLHLDLLMQ